MKNNQKQRIAVMAGFLAVGGVLLSGPGTSCSSFTAESLLVSADFCFIFDCQNGALGGAVDPCNGTGAVGSPTGPLLVDCP